MNERQQLDSIMSVIPEVPFKGIDKFYDINGLLNCPREFKMAMELIIDHYRTVEFDIIGCVDARGFLFGPVIGMALNKPVFMFRKNGKMPNSIVGDVYCKEYKSDTDDERLSIPNGLIGIKYKKVLIVDDLAATGGTFIAASHLVSHCGGEVVECACVIELSELNARRKLNDKGIRLWGLIKSPSPPE
jgi:adenine phosphoribosyltransferase